MAKSNRASVTKVKPRNKISVNKQAGILNNGEDNAYPTFIERIILQSVTSKSAAEMYSNFLVGDGFVDEALNDIVVGYQNYKPITLYTLLEKTARSIAFQNALSWHLNIQWTPETGLKYYEVQPVPYKNFRLGEPDDKDYSGKVVLYSNWDREKSKRIAKADFNVIDTYNARESVIMSQVEKAGGFDQYKGQVFWKFFDEEFNYPLSLVDVVRDDADTEYQISKFKNGELSRNFFAKYILRHAYFENDTDKAEFIRKIEEFQGGENNGSLMVIEDDIEEDENGEIQDNGLKFEKIEQNIDDKLFIDWEQSIANNIRKSFKAIPPVLIEYVEGKMGNTSGESLVQAGNFYNQVTKKDRAKMSQVFKEIFGESSLWVAPINSDFKIKTLTFGGEANE